MCPQNKENDLETNTGITKTITHISHTDIYYINFSELISPFNVFLFYQRKNYLRRMRKNRSSPREISIFGGLIPHFRKHFASLSLFKFVGFLGKIKSLHENC